MSGRDDTNLHGTMNPDAARLARDGQPYALTTEELAARWRISPRTLERWRHQDQGPPWLILGGRLRYRVADIVAWEETHKGGV